MKKGNRNLRAWHGGHRRPVWEADTPVGNPRGRHTQRDRARSWLKWLVFAGFAIGVAPPVADRVNGLLKPAHGCRVVRVIDGDTVSVRCPVTGTETARLTGFDTPELNARCPSELVAALGATIYLRYLLYTARTIVATPRDTDSNGRRRVLLTLDGQTAADTMIAAGLARSLDGNVRQDWCT